MHKYMMIWKIKENSEDNLILEEYKFEEKELNITYSIADIRIKLFKLSLKF